jgi:serine/threonine protein phosphatase PrpC
VASDTQDEKSSVELLLRPGFASDAGKKRTVNEDAYGHVKGSHFEAFIVSDGMGGPTCGGVASDLTISAFKKFIQPKDTIKVADVVAAVQEANKAVFIQAENDPELSGMGSTITALCFTDNKVIVANIGNSRAYRIRDGEITQLTVDHTLVQELIASGSLNNHPFFNKPGTHMLTRSVGTTMDVEVDCSQLDTEAKNGDIYLLCSDGLHDLVPEEELATLVLDESPEEVVNTLVELANSRGGHDNITVVVIAVGEGSDSGRKALRKPPTRGISSIISTSTSLGMAAKKEELKEEKEEEPEQHDSLEDAEEEHLDDQSDPTYETMKDLLKRRSEEQREKELRDEQESQKYKETDVAAKGILSSRPAISVPLAPFFIVGAVVCGFLFRHWIFGASSVKSANTAEKQQVAMIQPQAPVKKSEEIKEKVVESKAQEPSVEDRKFDKVLANIKEERLKAMFKEVMTAIGTVVKRSDAEILELSRRRAETENALNRLSEEIEAEQKKHERVEPADQILGEGL